MQRFARGNAECAEDAWHGSDECRVFTRYSDSLQQHGPRCVSSRIFIPSQGKVCGIGMRGGLTGGMRPATQPFHQLIRLSSSAHGALGFKFLMLRHHMTLIAACPSQMCAASAAMCARRALAWAEKIAWGLWLSPVELEITLNLAGASREGWHHRNSPFNTIVRGAPAAGSAYVPIAQERTRAHGWKTT
jgi:hypothetical protein